MDTLGGDGSVEINVSSRAYSHVFALVASIPPPRLVERGRIVVASRDPTSFRKTTPLKIPRQIIVREIDSPTVCRRSRIRCVLNRARSLLSPPLHHRGRRQRSFLSVVHTKDERVVTSAPPRLIEIDGSCDLPSLGNAWANKRAFYREEKRGTFIQRVFDAQLFHFSMGSDRARYLNHSQYLNNNQITKIRD